MLYQQPLLRKAKTIELAIPGGSVQTDFYFPDQPDLRDVLLLGIQIWIPGLIPVDYSNRPTINQNVFDRSFLTLYDMKGYRFVDQIPLFNFQPMVGAVPGNFWGMMFNGQKVNWTKSLIHCADPTVYTPVITEYYQISVFYELPSNIKKG